MTGPGVVWYPWVALASAVILGSRAIRFFMPSENDLRRAERRVRRRERRRERARHAEEQRRRRREPRDPQRTAEQFERVVEEGVEALLHAAADRIAAYNRERRQGAPRVRVEPAPEHDVERSAEGRGAGRGTPRR
jgi:hypothetical protein